MGLLQEIQASLVAENSNIGPILLKLRLLAAKIGSEPLAEWVKHEAEGYPKEVEVPDYRKIKVSYRGTFLGPYGSGYNNAPIPNTLIAKFAGEQWSTFRTRESISAVDALIEGSKNAKSGGELQINASDLILVLQGKVYEDYNCNDVKGTIGSSELVEIQNTVRNRILELTIELEKKVPAIAEISLEEKIESTSKSDIEKVDQITNNIFNGPVTAISNTGDNAQIAVSTIVGNSDAFRNTLLEAGVPEEDVKEITEIVANEKPDGDEPFGPKAKAWVLDKLKSAASGTWKMGMGVAAKVLEEAVKQYYGLP